MINYRLNIDTDKNIKDFLTTKKLKYFGNSGILESFSQSPLNEIISIIKQNKKILVKNKISNKDISVWINYEYE